MHSACNHKNSPAFDSFEREIARRVIAGDTRSVLYIVPTGAEARDLINRTTSISNTAAVSVPHILSLNELISAFRSVISPELELLSASQSAALIELALRKLFTHNKLEYFEQHGSGASLPVFQGTFDEIVSAINSIKERGVTVEELSSLFLSAPPSSEQRKLRDIIEIYREYEILLSGTSVDQHGQNFVIKYYLGLPINRDDISSVTRVTEIFRRLFPHVRDVFVAPFVRFAEPALDLLLALGYIDDITITYELDFARGNLQLFKYQDEFVNILRSHGFQFRETAPEHLHEHIAAFRLELRRRLFTRKSRSKSANDATKFDAGDFVIVHKAPVIEDEVRFVARTLKQLIRDNPDIEYSRIGVASSDQDRYAPLILSIFREYGIPFQLTHRTSLDHSSFFASIDNLLELGQYKLSRKRIRSLLESPYMTIRATTNELIDKGTLLRVLNRFSFPQGAKEWHGMMDELAADLRLQLQSATGDDLERQRAEQILNDLIIAREDMIVIEKLISTLSSARTPSAFVEHIRGLIGTLGVVSLILSGADTMLQADELEMDTRSYRAFIELSNELLTMCRTLGFADEKLPLSFYLERIRSAASKLRYTVRPEPSAAITVTSFDQTIGSEFDHLFLLGLRDGLFPSSYQPALFTPSAYSQTHDAHLIESRFLFYQTLCTTIGKLYLSHHSGTQDGSRAYHPSVFLEALDEIVTVSSSEIATPTIFSPGELYRSVARSLDWASDADVDALATTIESAGMQLSSVERLKNIEPALIAMEQVRRTSSTSIFSGVLRSGFLTDKEQARLEAYRETVFSVSQLETYAACGFKYFCRYILGINAPDTEPNEGLDSSEQGSMLHNSLYHILERFRVSGMNIRTMGDEAIPIANGIISELYPSSNTSSLDPFIQLDRERLFSRRGNEKSIIERFIETEQADALTKITSQPTYFELVFGDARAPQREGYPDPQQPVEIEGIKLRGKIDRIDMDDQGHVVVVDYKRTSGAIKKDIKTGYSLQLPLYLRIAEDMLRAHLGSDAVAGVGALYHLLNYGKEKRDFRIALKEAIDQKIIEQPPSKNKGTSTEEIAEFIESVIVFAKQYVDGIVTGRFPLVKESRRVKSCKFCEFNPICRVDQAAIDGVLPR